VRAGSPPCDVDHLAVAVLHQVHAAGVGQGIELLFEGLQGSSVSAACPGLMAAMVRGAPPAL